MSTELEPITPDEAIQMYLRDKQSEFADATLYSHKSRLGHFLRWCHSNNVDDLNELTGRQLHRYRLWRRDDGDLSKVSEKTQMDTIRVFIRWCESIDAVPPDMATKVTSPSLAAGDNVRDELVDVDQAEAILEYLNRYEYGSERHVTFLLMWRAALRRGSVVALDVTDYNSKDASLEVRHRPETDTGLKNKKEGERFIALTSTTTDVLDGWVNQRRPDVTDVHGREPLLATKQGRAHPTTIQTYIYSLTRPCLIDNECPHDRDVMECDAAKDRSKASKCPSSSSPHPVRRGALTHWLRSDLPESFAVSRANLSPEILREHYDRRSRRQKMDQRRKYLDEF